MNAFLASSFYLAVADDSSQNNQVDRRTDATPVDNKCNIKSYDSRPSRVLNCNLIWIHFKLEWRQPTPEERSSPAQDISVGRN